MNSNKIEMITSTSLILDSAIKSINDDELGRKNLVKSIVDSIKIKSSEPHACYTIGIYGKWGEGKTSVLNMVKGDIKKNDNFNIIEFNPWLFKDQESLLLDFFKALQNGITSKDVVDKIKQYGHIVSLGISGQLNIVLLGLGITAKGAFDNFAM